MSDNPTADALARIWQDSLAYGGPRHPLTPARLAEARDLYAALTAPADRTAAWHAYHERGVTLADERPPLVRARFAGDWDADDPGFPGYTTRRTWNGWALPYVTRETLAAVVLPRMNDGAQRWEIGDDDALTVTYLDGHPCEGEDPTVIHPEILPTVDGDALVWEIGLGLCWVEAPALYLPECYFCRKPWGSCACPELSEAEALDTGDMIVTAPGLSECSRFYVDPRLAYGETFDRWIETAPAYYREADAARRARG